MTMTLTAAGIDVGRDALDVAVAPSGKAFRAPNGAKGVRLITDRLRRLGVVRVVIEAIGPYAARLVRALVDCGFEVGVVDPKRIKAFRAAEAGLTKTDRLDAKLIARFALVMGDSLNPIPSADQMELRALSTRRRQLVEMAAMEKVRLKQAIDDGIAESHREMIRMLESERARLDARIEARLIASPQGAQRLALLKTIPGVGPAIAATLLADMPELGALDRKAAASLAGLAPHLTQSGTMPARGQIKGGRPCVRAALYMGALSATRTEKGYKREYQAMRNAGKPPKVAIIAIARKMIVTANAMLKNNTPWTQQNETTID